MIALWSLAAYLPEQSANSPVHVGAQSLARNRSQRMWGRSSGREQDECAEWAKSAECRARGGGGEGGGGAGDS